MKYFLFCTLALSFSLFAQEPLDEAAMFGDTSSMVDTSGAQQKPMAAMLVDNIGKTTVGFSGQIQSQVSGSATRDFPDSSLGFGSATVGNVMLDIRLSDGMKAFANLEALYTGSSSGMLVNLREVFVDANINHRVYFRLGKQVLQWGRCSFFNPTDLINVEKKLIVQKIGYREGAYGLKAHVPFGTFVNLYGFIDAKDATTVDSLAGAAKAEILIGGTELAVSLWSKKNREPVTGFDFSTAVDKFQINGEVSASYGANARSLVTGEIITLTNPRTSKIDTFTNLTTEKKEDAWVTRAALGVSRSFDCMDVNDRITVLVEGYYNSNGYTKNYWKDTRQFYYDVPLKVEVSSDSTLKRPGGSAALYLQGNGLYEANSYSPWYLAFFTSVSKFIVSDMTLSLNGIMNIEQQSAMVAAGVNYTTLSNFSVGCTFIGYLGEKNTEYTISPIPGKLQAAAVTVTAGMSF